MLVARCVQFEVEELYELEGTISAADPAARTFVVRDITVAWGADTTIVGGSAQLLAVNRRVATKGVLSVDRLRLQARSIHVEA